MKYLDLDIDFDDNEEDDYYSYKTEKKNIKNKKIDYDGFEIINRKNNKHRNNNKRMVEDFFN